MVQEFGWKNERGLQIYAADWHVADPRAVIGIIHGLGEHCRRYDHLAAFFNERNIAVIGYDRQGFGRSEGKKGYAKNYRDYLDGVAQLLVQCERRYPDRPVFLYGQSMGGQLLLHYLIRRKPAISGAIVSSPHIAEAFSPNPVTVAVGKLMRRLYPTFTLSNQLDLTKISRDPAVVAAYRADPYNHDRLSSQTGIDLLERAAFLQAYSGGLHVPTLLLHGTADGLTSHDASAAFAERNPQHLTFHSFPGMYHELHNEPENEAVMQLIGEWVDERLP
ncbi:alpha-beta hydrolase superfamily lysophospholipase [Lewinella aquimaris]|uniref:Monoacylglycerol lipase n=1 Tax=Neolewinella aquimaris TaxID=1835722 RepID=A0A840E470_9BACT|nr:alpha/beta hydrolase [Neolewinella aquimaris]MBB4077897.1 alpha-beta hydrolase superfamily lysophospholipase [Neolewinella aquimaris]